MNAKTEREPCEPSPTISSQPSDKPTYAERGREIAELVLMGLKLGVTEEQQQRQRQQEAARSLQPAVAGTPSPRSGIYEKVGPRDGAKSESEASAARRVLANKRPKRKLRAVYKAAGKSQAVPLMAEPRVSPARGQNFYVAEPE